MCWLCVYYYYYYYYLCSCLTHRCHMVLVYMVWHGTRLHRRHIENNYCSWPHDLTAHYCTYSLREQLLLVPSDLFMHQHEMAFELSHSSSVTSDGSSIVSDMRNGVRRHCISMTLSGHRRPNVEARFARCAKVATAVCSAFWYIAAWCEPTLLNPSTTQAQ